MQEQRDVLNYIVGKAIEDKGDESEDDRIKHAEENNEEDTMTQDTTKKSAPENEETIQDVFNTFNEKQRLVLNYIVGKTVEGDLYEETILGVLDTFNEKQRLVLKYIVGKAVEDAKKGKTSESDEDEPENDNTESNEEDKLWVL